MTYAQNNVAGDEQTQGSYRLSVISANGKQLENGSVEGKPEDKEARAQWGSNIEFLMSCVAFSVGLGNVWRFPSTAYENGGGAFLVPYLVVLFIIGKPIYYMEMILGQFSSRSCVEVWSVVPGFKGIGYGVTVSVFSVVTYYCSLMSLTMYYLLASFQSVLPWAVCWEEWGNVCFDSTSASNATSNVNKSSSAELYFRYVVLNESGIEEGLGEPSWKLVVALFVSWTCVFVVIRNGVKSTGKAAYFLALFPYVIMICLLVRAVTLEGAVNGIIFLFEPTWEKIFDPSVWYAAVTQSFFSLGVCFGAVTMYSSYNRFDHNVLRDCTVVTTMDLATSLIAGTTIFGILGNLAHEVGKEDISTVVRAGTGLAFISYPEALAKFTVVPQLFAVLFFLMLFVLGIGTTVAFTGVITSIIKDKFPRIPNWKVAACVTSIGFLIGIVYCTQGGQHVLNLVDYFGGTFIIVFLASFEVIGISWVYGVDNFLDDVEFMIGNRPSFYWRFCWGFLTPLALFSILIYFLSELTPLTYNGEYYPTSAYVAGWLLLVLGVIQFPIWIIVTRMQNKDKPALDILKPDPDWGPKDPSKYKEWKAFKDAKRISRMNLGKKRSRIVTLLIGGD
ncbi:sodium-dependent nutrient amino acid transporter 1-like [Hylaeus anthracinus]|uniref:sodium-dependent nutrient amino acid transporter 1-like n=1 Tax=Hylaeus anthracinus TaxID=313031 RepID=UPI0023B9AE96|nr:sodium-dependent nutrient amino acid transporter 1-like [Hylaeus anthracinus]XP_054009979.1 sodium-dependent nutrient amino acid transporter 1-like [Hylaeus anthracinus]